MENILDILEKIHKAALRFLLPLTLKETYKLIVKEATSSIGEYFVKGTEPAKCLPTPTPKPSSSPTVTPSPTDNAPPNKEEKKDNKKD